MELLEEFVPYTEALALKELGFNEYCMGACYYEFKDRGNTHMLLHTPDEYDSKIGVDAPLFQQAFRWFREKYSDLDFGVAKIHNGTNNYHYHINLAWEFFEGTYEEAELACLRKLIEIVKEKQ